jgi:signal transduction histidine kinase/ligand-binding sensor domain-containing protein
MGNIEEIRDNRAMESRAALAIGLVLACCRCALALDPSFDINQYAHNAWTIRDGFFNSAVHAIAQTPDGYLWLGTETGVVRFDGVRTVAWQPPAGQRLPSMNIWKLMATRDGRLWIGTAAGLASWKDGRLVQYPELDGQVISALVEDRSGTVWATGIGVPTGRLCAVQGGGVQCSGQDGTLGRGVLCLLEYAGNLWVGSDTGLWRWQPGPPKRYLFSAPAPEYTSLNSLPDGSLLVLSRYGLLRFTAEKLEPYRIPGASQPKGSGFLLRDRDAGLWIGTFGHGLSHVHEGRTDVFSKADGLSSDSIQALYEDHEGNLWVATSEGLDRFRELAIPTLSAKQGLSGFGAFSVLATKDGSVWLPSQGGLNRWKNGQIAVYTKRESLPDDSSACLFEDDRQRLWVSTLRGIARFENGRFVPLASLSRSRIVYNIVEAGAGIFWINDQEQGLIHLVGDKEVGRTPWSELGHSDQATTMAYDPGRDGLWLGFYNGGVIFIKDGHVRASYATAGEPGPRRVTEVQVHADGSVWAATIGGLSRIKDNHVATLNSRNGLPCDTVHWMIEDDDHTAWLYTSCGLARISKAEMDAWIADPSRSVKSTLFDSSSGVEIAALAGGYSPQVTKSSDGRLWFATPAGVSIIDPQHLSANKISPMVHIERIVADRELRWQNLSASALSNLNLPALSRDVEIDYTGLSLGAPERIRFRYKLEGHDRDWQDVGTRRQAFYNDLPPRKYRFRITAANNNGVWNETGDALEFTIAPAYYQTAWFEALCAMAFLALLWGVYRVRLYQIAREFNVRLEERVGERTRIARDLHDTLLQSFQGLMLRLQVVNELLPDGKAKEQLETTLERADQAIAEGRGAVYDLRSSVTITNELPEAVRALGDELATGDSAAFRLVVEGSTRDLHPIIRDEVYRISREALRNAFSHAQARNIETELTYAERAFRLRIRDDGAGIPSEILEQGRAGHYGLPGMRERARQVGGKLEIWSGPRAGTEIELSIPGSVAYSAVTGRPAFRLFRKKAG